jgi:cell wall-associated NlpC family hydrolase
MDRRVRALIEQQRRREEARRRASFAGFMDAARAKGLAAAQDRRASAAALRAVRVALAQLGASYRWDGRGRASSTARG